MYRGQNGVLKSKDNTRRRMGGQTSALVENAKRAFELLSSCVYRKKYNNKNGCLLVSEGVIDVHSLLFFITVNERPSIMYTVLAS